MASARNVVRQQSKAQYRDHTNTEKVTAIHEVSSLVRELFCAETGAQSGVQS